MNAVAPTAGIGAGAGNRRFGEVAHLLPTLLDHREQQLQEALLDGPARAAEPLHVVTGFAHGRQVLLDLANCSSENRVAASAVATGSRSRRTSMRSRRAAESPCSSSHRCHRLRTRDALTACLRTSRVAARPPHGPKHSMSCAEQ